MMLQTLRLDECECTRRELEASHDLISREKEEMAMVSHNGNLHTILMSYSLSSCGV